MLNLTPEQLVTMEASLADDFMQRVAARLFEVFPAQMKQIREVSGGDEGVRKFVADAVARAERLGLQRERDLVSFMVVLLTNAQLQGKEVGFFGWARPLFDRPDTAGHMKVAMIELRLQAMRRNHPIAERVCVALEAAVDGF